MKDQTQFVVLLRVSSFTQPTLDIIGVTIGRGLIYVNKTEPSKIKKKALKRQDQPSEQGLTTYISPKLH